MLLKVPDSAAVPVHQCTSRLLAVLEFESIVTLLHVMYVTRPADSCQASASHMQLLCMQTAGGTIPRLVYLHRVR
jgi:hypothetical protein